MTVQNLTLLDPTRRYATLAAVILETRATVLDELVDLPEWMLGKWFNRAKRKHAEQFQDSGKAINHQLRLFRRIGTALVSAKEKGRDAFQAIESVVPWDVFVESVIEAEKLSQPASFEHLRHIEDGYGQIRRYTPALLETLSLKAAPAAQNVLDGMQTLKIFNDSQKRKVPDNAPISFIKKRWMPLVMSEAGIERCYYELCALMELKNSLRSGDITVQGSRQFKDFEDYLLPKPQNSEQNGKNYLEARLKIYKHELIIHL